MQKTSSIRSLSTQTPSPSHSSKDNNVPVLSQESRIEGDTVAVTLLTAETLWSVDRHHRKRTSTKNKTQSSQAKAKPSGEVAVFSDVTMAITDRADGIRVIRLQQSSIFTHPDVKANVVVYTDGSVWWVGVTGTVRHDVHRTRASVERAAIAKLQLMVASGTAAGSASNESQPKLFD